MDAQLSVIVTTFERPWHLRRVLLSLAVQREVPCPWEIVVADDGSRDETPAVVEAFRRESPVPVTFVTHPHQEFWPARARNEGFAASRGAYILFLDADCLVPPDHLAIHLQSRTKDRAFTTDCVRWDAATTERVTEDVVRNGDYLGWIPRSERQRLRRAHRRAVFYHLIRHPQKPRVMSGNLAVWREDFLCINGFDENYREWGCEDDDLGLRLQQSGVRVCSIRDRTVTYHLWHPPVRSVPHKAREGKNFAYLHRRGRLACCRNGLVKRSWQTLALTVTGRVEADFALPSAQQLLTRLAQADTTSPADDRPEVEILFWDGGQTGFRTAAPCKVLVVTDGVLPPRKILHQGDWLVADEDASASLGRWLKPGTRIAPLAQFADVLDNLG